MPAGIENVRVSGHGSRRVTGDRSQQSQRCHRSHQRASSRSRIPSAKKSLFGRRSGRRNSFTFFQIGKLRQCHHTTLHAVETPHNTTDMMHTAYHTPRTTNTTQHTQQLLQQVLTQRGSSRSLLKVKVVKTARVTMSLSRWPKCLASGLIRIPVFCLLCSETTAKQWIRNGHMSHR